MEFECAEFSKKGFYAVIRASCQNFLVVCNLSTNNTLFELKGTQLVEIRSWLNFAREQHDYVFRILGKTPSELLVFSSNSTTIKIISLAEGSDLVIKTDYPQETVVALPDTLSPACWASVDRETLWIRNEKFEPLQKLKLPSFSGFGNTILKWHLNGDKLDLFVWRCMTRRDTIANSPLYWTRWWTREQSFGTWSVALSFDEMRSIAKLPMGPYLDFYVVVYNSLFYVLERFGWKSESGCFQPRNIRTKIDDNDSWSSLFNEHWLFLDEKLLLLLPEGLGQHRVSPLNDAPLHRFILDQADSRTIWFQASPHFQPLSGLRLRAKAPSLGDLASSALAKETHRFLVELDPHLLNSFKSTFDNLTKITMT